MGGVIWWDRAPWPAVGKKPMEEPSVLVQLLSVLIARDLC